MVKACLLATDETPESILEVLCSHGYVIRRIACVQGMTIVAGATSTVGSTELLPVELIFCTKGPVAAGCCSSPTREGMGLQRSAGRKKSKESMGNCVGEVCDSSRRDMCNWVVYGSSGLNGNGTQPRMRDSALF
ncbi:hypothetical protein KP509_31G037500 [Ceratopteris richardii]|uniref:Uncharacterized protein n=1 Tax=Ceratopteris richardii TaxID=49495 RepID=A0A8T2QZ28_CERRI|nr:hypothetical protein KP509_31G037500 [Ceratopteris richardii]